MKKILVFSLVLFSLIHSANARPANDSIPADPKDVSSVDALVAALYDVISGPAGKKRNWDRMRTLFVPEARMISTGKGPEGEIIRRTRSVEEYINSSGPLLERDGFFETEIGRSTDQYGNIVHIFSAYESKRAKADEKPFTRGINSIQLWNDGKRWWIITILWQSENNENPIPGKYIERKN